MNLAEQDGKKEAEFCTGVSQGKQNGLRIPSASLPVKKCKPCDCRNSNFDAQLNGGGKQAPPRAARREKRAHRRLCSCLCSLPCVGAHWPGSSPGGPWPPGPVLRLGTGSRARAGGLSPFPSAEALVRGFLLYPAVCFNETYRNL